MSLKASWKPTWAAPTLGSVSAFCTRAPSSEKEKQHDPSTLREVSQPMAQFTATREMIQPLHTVIPEYLKIHFSVVDFLVCASSPWLVKSAETEVDFKLAANTISLVNYRYSHKAKCKKCITCRSVSSIQ